ncbi:MAG: hypothetical protein DDT28_00371 [Dehalococcoidia bacterium]|nr:hypothetical protein [Chloroflexota bacterium]MBT9159023.1 hypothetical protein [Chloroflexota bacterium]
MMETTCKGLRFMVKLIVVKRNSKNEADESRLKFLYYCCCWYLLIPNPDELEPKNQKLEQKYLALSYARPKKYPAIFAHNFRF